VLRFCGATLAKSPEAFLAAQRSSAQRMCERTYNSCTPFCPGVDVIVIKSRVYVLMLLLSFFGQMRNSPLPALTKATP